MRVVRLEVANNRLRLVEHQEGGNLEVRHKDANDPFRWTFLSFNRLRGLGAHQVRIDEVGRAHASGCLP
jgi:CRISPR-associated endonuclease Csn1